MKRVFRWWVLGWVLFLMSPSGAARAEWHDASSGRGAVYFLTDLGRGDTGAGLGVSFGGEAYRTEQFGLRVNAGYFQLETLRAGSPFSPPYEDDLNALYLNAGPIFRLSNTRFSPYLTGGAGMYLMDYDAFTSIFVGGGLFAEVALTGGSLNLGLNGGGGFDFGLGDGFSIGAELDYTTVLSEGRNLELLGVHVGLEYLFDSP